MDVRMHRIPTILNRFERNARNHEMHTAILSESEEFVDI